MPVMISMPQLGEAIAEATIDRWLKQVGDPIQRFEPLLEVLTEKVNTEIPSPVDGVLAQITAPEGTTVRIGEAIAWVEQVGPGDAAAAPSADAGEEVTEAVSSVAPDTSPRLAGPLFPSEAAPAGPPRPFATPEPVSVPAPVPSIPGIVPGAGTNVRPPFSPAVRRLAAEYGVDPRAVQGTGQGGRVTREDVIAYVGARRAAVEPSADRHADRLAARSAATDTVLASAPASAQAAEAELVAPSALRRTIAERMVESTRNIPHAWMMVEADVTGLVRLRQSVKEEFLRREGFDLTYLPFFVKAVVEGLRQQPTLNASWTEEGILYRRQIHLGIAVAAEEGLVVPVLRAADGMSVAGIARAVHDLAARARAGDLTPEEMRGGTFTVNNTGALGSIVSMPIISPRQSGIITLETIQARPAVVGEGIAIRHIVNLSFSFDHRIADGLVAGRFMQVVRRVMESFAPGDPVY